MQNLSGVLFENRGKYTSIDMLIEQAVPSRFECGLIIMPFFLALNNFFNN